jgi:hypothetical protein
MVPMATLFAQKGLRVAQMELGLAVLVMGRPFPVAKKLSSVQQERYAEQPILAPKNVVI